MKKIIVLLISVLFFSSGFAQKSLTITGKVEGFAEGKIYLNKITSPTPTKIDSIDVKNGAFTFSKGITNTDVYMVNFGKSRSGVVVFPENQNIQLTVKLNSGIIDNADVKAGPIQQVYQDYTKTVKEAGVEMNKLYLAYQSAKTAKNDAETARLEKDLNAKSDATDAVEAKIQEMNASNLLGLFLITRKVYAYDYEKLKDCLSKVSPVAQKSDIYRSLSERLAKMDKVRVGSNSA